MVFFKNLKWYPPECGNVDNIGNSGNVDNVCNFGDVSREKHPPPWM